jgi:hypothetical protein
MKQHVVKLLKRKWFAPELGKTRAGSEAIANSGARSTIRRTA